MVSLVKKSASDWTFDCISLGYPGRSSTGIRFANRTTWVADGWDSTEEAFGCPVKVLNDAAMQAVGSLGRPDVISRIGNGPGIRDDRRWHSAAMERAHLAYKNGNPMRTILVCAASNAWARGSGAALAKVTKQPKPLEADYIVWAENRRN
jgi:hypothetical protein